MEKITPQDMQRPINFTANEFISYWKREKEPEGNLVHAVKYIQDENNNTTVEFSNIRVNRKIEILDQSDSLPDLILDNCVLEDFDIIRSKCGNISFLNNSIVGDVWIFDNSVVREIDIKNKTTVGDFKISISIVDSIRIRNKCETGFFDIRNSEVEGFSIRAGSKTGYIEFATCQVGDLHILGKSNILSLWIGRKSTLAEIKIKDSFLNSITLENNKLVEHFQCNFLPDQPAQILLKNTDFGRLNFKSAVFPESSTISLLNCGVNQLSFLDTCNYGRLIFSDIRTFENWSSFKRNTSKDLVYKHGVFEREEKESASTLCFANSDLGNFQIINSNLSKFQRFEFENSKMLDIFLAGSELPKDFFFLDGMILEKQNEQKRLAFGQFKKIYENQGDRASSLEYLALEMEAYREQLKNQNHKLFSKDWWDNRAERLTLLLNRYSTNYGNNWLQGAGVTLLVMWICFTIYGRSLGYVLGDGSEAHQDKFWELFSYSFYFLNPLRDMDSIALVKGDELSAFARTWDFISRIIVAYFSVQAIQAFRKLGKSSG